MNEVVVAESLRGSFLESVLLQVNERGGRMSTVDLDAFADDVRATIEAATQLHDLQLAEQPSSAGVVLTPFGLRTADLIRQSLRPGGRRRADAVQRAVLKWLRGKSIDPRSIEEFLVQPESAVFGEVVQPWELVEAAGLLEDRGFIRTVATNQKAFLRPRITPDGTVALMSNVMISEYGRPNATMINNDYSNRVTFGDHANAGAVNAGGSGNSQTVVQVIGPEKWEAFADRLADLQRQAREIEGADQIGQQLEAMTQETDPAKRRPEVIKDLALKLMGASVVVMGTEAGNALVAGIAQLPQLLS